MAILFGDIDSYLKSLMEEADSQKQKPLNFPSDPSTSKKYDLVILEPDHEEMLEWRDWHKALNNGPKKVRGWCCYIASNAEYFGSKGNFQKCFDCPEFPESFKNLEGASDALVTYLYGWMLQNDCEYEMEGFIGFYSVNTKKDAINLLKQCPVIGNIHEIDENDNIIATY